MTDVVKPHPERSPFIEDLSEMGAKIDQELFIMEGKNMLDTFVSASPFCTDPSYRKKLRFIFSGVTSFALLQNKTLPELHILEVGCGIGGITLPLASLGCRVRAFDISEETVESVKLNCSQRGHANLTVTVDNGYTFDDGNVYDIVIASEVFEHVRNPLKLATNIARRMIDGSILIVTTPNGYGPWELRNRISPHYFLKKQNLLRHLFGKPTYVEGVVHCQFYTRRRLVRLFSQLSFKLLRSANSDSILTVFRSLRTSEAVKSIDVRLADVLPCWLAGGWYFLFQLEGSSNCQASLTGNN